MKSELQILIEELQREYDSLEKELNACVKEWDFEGAEVYKEPLYYVKEKLRILKNLENPNYDKIISLRRRIERLRNYEAKNEFSRFAIQRMKDRIPEFEEELSKLESREKKFHYDSDELIVCLERLLLKEVSQFKIEIEEGVVFEISKRESNLKIEIRRADKNPLDYATTRIGLTELRKTGFQVHEKTAIKEVTEFHEKQILPIIELLSKIVFEVFRLYGNMKARIKLNTTI